MSVTSTPPKQKVSLSLDADIVAAFERDGPLSSQVNEALRAEVERREHQAAIRSLLSRWEAEDGPLDSPEDEAEIARIAGLLS